MKIGKMNEHKMIFVSKQGTQACIKWTEIGYNIEDTTSYVMVCDTKAKSNSNWQLYVYIEQTFLIILVVCIQRCTVVFAVCKKGQPCV